MPSGRASWQSEQAAPPESMWAAFSLSACFALQTGPPDSFMLRTSSCAAWRWWRRRGCPGYCGKPRKHAPLAPSSVRTFESLTFLSNSCQLAMSAWRLHAKVSTRERTPATRHWGRHGRSHCIGHPVHYQPTPSGLPCTTKKKTNARAQAIQKTRHQNVILGQVGAKDVDQSNEARIPDVVPV